MFGALKRGRLQSLASLILVVNVVGELQQKRTLAASRGFLAPARLSCFNCCSYQRMIARKKKDKRIQLQRKEHDITRTDE